MNKITINLRKETFYINESGSVIGDICFAVDDWFFPAKDWGDFAVLLISCLAHITTELIVGNQKTVELRFMEGCFQVSISLDKNNQSVVKFIDGDRFADQKEIVLKTVTIPFEAFKNEVRSACETFIQMKESKELDFEDDYEELKESYELLCKC